MPCMGPMMPTDKEIDKVTKEVMEFLRKKYRVHSKNPTLAKLIQPSRDREKASLRQSVKLLLVGRNCEEF